MEKSVIFIVPNNAAAVTFPACTGGSNTVVAFGILTASSSGDLLFWGDITDPAGGLAVTTGEIYYDVAETSDLDMEGAWTVWSHITFDDGDVAAGDPVKMAVYTEGSNRPLRLVWN